MNWGENPAFSRPPASGCQPPQIARRVSHAAATGGIAEARLQSRFVRSRSGLPFLIPPGRDGEGTFGRKSGLSAFSRFAGTAP
jgi:hypothetical protein